MRDSRRGGVAVPGLRVISNDGQAQFCSSRPVEGRQVAPDQCVLLLFLMARPLLINVSSSIESAFSFGHLVKIPEAHRSQFKILVGTPQRPEATFFSSPQHQPIGNAWLVAGLCVGVDVALVE